MSIIRDVVNCVHEMDHIGVKKRKARDQGKKRIHSYKTKQETLKIGKQFARWVKDNHGINKLHSVTEQHYRDFLESKVHTTLDYRRSIETHLRLIQEGLNLRADRFGKDQVRFVTEKRLIAPRERMEGVSNRSYSDKETKAVQGAVSPSVARSVALMRNLGLRVGESVGLRVEQIQGDFVRIKNDTITKGGRDRIIPIPPAFREELSRMCEGKETHERLVQITARAVQNDINRVCKDLKLVSRGAHGFRHSYARERVSQLMTSNERDLFNRCIERYAEGKPFDYAVRDRELYGSMKEKMDRVHSELGHGKDRFDLAVRYMA